MDGNHRLAVVFQPSDDSYGIDRVLTRIVDVLISDGWRVRCIIESTNPGTGWLSNEMARRGIPTVKIPLANLGRRHIRNPLLLLRWVVHALLAFRGTLRQAKHADVLYINGATLPLPALVGRASRRRVIWHLHEIPPWGRLLGRVVRALSSQQVCVSRAVADAFGLADSAGCQVLYNAVDIPAQAVGQPDTGEDQPLEIGIVARINRGKGHLVLGAAFKELLLRGLPVRLHVVGAPHASDQAVAYELTHELREVPANRIVWAGEVFSGSAYMQNLHVLAAPSIHPDPFPLSVLEGMAAGLAVVASDCGGHREAIMDRETGLLCRPRDQADLARQLAYLVEQPDMRRSIAKQGRESAIDRFAPFAFAAKLLALVNGPGTTHD